MSDASTGTGCGCGCGGKKTCELASPARPRFFCGQLLTDQDLSELAGWVRDKRALARFREGWGVLCGLDVRADPRVPGGILVRSGYAVSSCGEDIVLPEQVAFDLTASCPPPVPCGSTGEQEPPGDCVLDLGVAYAEVGGDPVLALGRSVCGETGECENSRIVESFRFVATRAVDGAEPERPDWRRWREGYAEAACLLEKARTDGVAGDGVTPEARLAWLREAVRTRPPAHFGFVVDLLDAEQVTGPRFVWLLYWLVQDSVLAFLGDGCPGGCAGEAVSLARVWLHRTRTADGRWQWIVRAIDPGTLYRRPFGPADWPAPRGKVNFARLLWHQPEEACFEVRKLGLTIAAPPQEWRIPGTLGELDWMLGKPPVYCCDKQVTLRYVTMPPEAPPTGVRVVGFRADPPAPAGDGEAPGLLGGEAPGPPPNSEGTGTS
ncbi:hypothetical protein [Amycolatopsis samaneae]|uniref:Uncharacterized protein n=1 Tax=Amycolatopsis samaneae TaxID=664691 RepID=A0ABW5GGZ5_9PSEU